MTRLLFYSKHPTTSIPSDESPRSEYRPTEGRTLMWRHFDSLVTRLANGRSDDVQPRLARVGQRCRIYEAVQAVDPASSAGYCFKWNLPFDGKTRDQHRETPGVKHGSYRLLRHFEIKRTTPRHFGAE